LKYIKKFEKSNSKEKIQELAYYIHNFINKNQNEIIYSYEYNCDYAFSYNKNDIQRNCFLNLRLSTNNDYFLFDINTILDNPGWIDSEIEKISKFIKYIMDKYSELGRIKITEIDNIINDISKENYEIYLNALKFNL